MSALIQAPPTIVLQNHLPATRKRTGYAYPKDRSLPGAQKVLRAASFKSSSLLGFKVPKAYTSKVFARRTSLLVFDSLPTFEVTLDTIDARKQLLLEQIVFEDGYSAIYVAGVANGAEAQEAGILPGMCLRAVSDPIEKTQLWEFTGQEKLRNVKDAINTTRAYTVKLVLDSDPTISAAMAEEYAGSLVSKDGEEAAAPTPKPTPAATKVDREDLYTDNWEGDVYVGSRWNVLSVGLALTIAVPVLGLIFALSTRGVLWGLNY
ncbi:hypothetical protein CYMTET_22958 [Cymbomonas tetramitiformis]|uniref:Uncharacterized protein n=1 Tax=Cymbomonas tetramitiformis TaxID=36881 RepID=A0AAE0FZQ1_9CHLO|nr:hypothetical protein CYMTET_22958 [Cymbomonas tetramitiformis]